MPVVVSIQAVVLIQTVAPSTQTVVPIHTLVSIQAAIVFQTVVPTQTVGVSTQPPVPIQTKPPIEALQTEAPIPLEAALSTVTDLQTHLSNQTRPCSNSSPGEVWSRVQVLT